MDSHPQEGAQVWVPRLEINHSYTTMEGAAARLEHSWECQQKSLHPIFNSKVS